MRHFDTSGSRERDYAEQCGPDQGEDCGGSGQWANDTSRGRSAGAEGNHAAAGHSGECGRRDGELLRMGAGFAELLLVGSGSERETGIGDAARVCGSARKLAETSDAHANRGILFGGWTRGGCDARARIVPVGLSAERIVGKTFGSQGKPSTLRASMPSVAGKPAPLKDLARVHPPILEESLRELFLFGQPSKINHNVDCAVSLSFAQIEDFTRYHV